MTSEFLKGYSELIEAWKSKTGHTFILTGNNRDFSSTSGDRNDMVRWLYVRLDSHMKEDLEGKTAIEPSEVNFEKIMVTYEISGGLKAIHPKGQEILESLVKGFGLDPLPNLETLVKTIVEREISNRITRAVNKKHSTMLKSYQINVVFPRAEMVFPAEGYDKAWVDALLSWTQREQNGDRCRFILLSQSVDKLAHPVRSCDRISVIGIALPDEETRLSWIHGFDTTMRERTKSKPLEIRSKIINGVEIANGYSFEQMAKDTSGMRLVEIEDIIVNSWVLDTSINQEMVIRAQSRLVSQRVQKGLGPAEAQV